VRSGGGEYVGSCLAQSCSACTGYGPLSRLAFGIFDARIGRWINTAQRSFSDNAADHEFASLTAPVRKLARFVPALDLRL
jgi:hypothetical protein